jgi:hypothetical protein
VPKIINCLKDKYWDRIAWRQLPYSELFSAFPGTYCFTGLLGLFVLQARGVADPIPQGRSTSVLFCTWFDVFFRFYSPLLVSQLKIFQSAGVNSVFETDISRCLRFSQTADFERKGARDGDGVAQGPRVRVRCCAPYRDDLMIQMHVASRAHKHFRIQRAKDKC